MRRALTLLSVLVVLAAGCGGDNGGAGEDPDAPPDEPVRIRMGWSIPAEEIKYLMQHDPSLAPNLGTWYEIEWFQLGGTPQQVQQMAAGTLDGGTVGSLTVANGIDQGADFVLTGQFVEERPGYAALTWLVRKDSGISSPADLAGTTVGTTVVGGYSDYVQDFYIHDEGGLEANRDYRKIEVPFSKMQEAMETGQVSTGPFVPPFSLKAMATGEYRPLFSTVDVFPQGSVPILQAFSRGFVEEHPVAARKFVEDWTAVARWRARPENRGEAIRASSAVTGIPVKVLDRYLFTKKDFYRSPDGAINVEALQANWDFFHGQGAFRSALKVKDHIEPELVPGAGT